MYQQQERAVKRITYGLMHGGQNGIISPKKILLFVNVKYYQLQVLFANYFTNQNHIEDLYSNSSFCRSTNFEMTNYNVTSTTFLEMENTLITP